MKKNVVNVAIMLVSLFAFLNLIEFNPFLLWEPYRLWLSAVIRWLPPGLVCILPFLLLIGVLAGAGFVSIRVNKAIKMQQNV